MPVTELGKAERARKMNALRYSGEAFKDIRLSQGTGQFTQPAPRLAAHFPLTSIHSLLGPKKMYWS